MNNGPGDDFGRKLYVWSFRSELLNLFNFTMHKMDDLVAVTLNNGVKIPLLGFNPEVKVCLKRHCMVL